MTGPLGVGRTSVSREPSPGRGATRPAIERVFWGDLHLHSNLSPDAYIFENRMLDRPRPISLPPERVCSLRQAHWLSWTAARFSGSDGSR